MSKAKIRNGQKTRHNERGFTLVEVLVVITIIALMMGLVGPRVLNYLTESKTKAAKIQIEGFSAALDLFFIDAGRYPTSSEGLPALLLRPGSANGWKNDATPLSDQTGEQLGLGVQFGAELVGVGAQGGLSGVQGPPSHDDRRFA